MTTQVSLYSKQGMPKVFLACLLMIALVGPSWTQAQAQAADCPQVGVSGAQHERFCQEFRKLLYAPYKPLAKRSAPSKKQRSEAEEFLKSDPLWGEVYRSDPKRTLALIERIKKAGGQPQ